MFGEPRNSSLVKVYDDNFTKKIILDEFSNAFWKEEKSRHLTTHNVMSRPGVDNKSGSAGLETEQRNSRKLAQTLGPLPGDEGGSGLQFI